MSNHDEDQEHQHVGAEHVPGVAAHGPPAFVERARTRPSPPITMLGTISDQNVSRISPGTMISAKPTRDADTGQDGRGDDRGQERHHRRHGLAQVQVRPAVPDVLYRFDEGGLDQERGNHRR